MSESKNGDFCPVSIKVLGVGGGGGNAVERMVRSGMEGAEFINVNTDIKSLKSSKAHKTIQIGENNKRPRRRGKAGHWGKGRVRK